MRGSFTVPRTARLLPCLLMLLLHAAGVVQAANETTKEDAHHSAEAEHHIHADRAVLFPWFANILGIVSFFLLARYLHAFPYTASMFCLGVFMGAGASRLGGTSQLHESFELWNNIDGNVLLLVFLPGLLFKDAFCSNVHLMSLAFSQCLVMGL